jgi:hypothetical protein
MKEYGISVLTIYMQWTTCGAVNFIQLVTLYTGIEHDTNKSQHVFSITRTDDNFCNQRRYCEKCIIHDSYNNSVDHKNKAMQTGPSLLS